MTDGGYAIAGVIIAFASLGFAWFGVAFSQLNRRVENAEEELKACSRTRDALARENINLMRQVLHMPASEFPPERAEQ